VRHRGMDGEDLRGRGSGVADEKNPGVRGIQRIIFVQIIFS
jgi:hypothetical protein